MPCIFIRKSSLYQICDLFLKTVNSFSKNEVLWELSVYRFVLIEPCDSTFPPGCGQCVPRRCWCPRRCSPGRWTLYTQSSVLKIISFLCTSGYMLISILHRSSLAEYAELSEALAVMAERAFSKLYNNGEFYQQFWLYDIR